MTCFSSQVDFTSCGGFLCIAAVLLMIIGIVTAIVLSFQYVSLLWSSHLIYSVYSCFSAWGTAAPKGVSVWPISHSGAFLMSLNRSPGCICSTLQLEPSFTLWWVHTHTKLDRVFLLGISVCCWKASETLAVLTPPIHSYLGALNNVVIIYYSSSYLSWFWLVYQIKAFFTLELWKCRASWHVFCDLPFVKSSFSLGVMPKEEAPACPKLQNGHDQYISWKFFHCVLIFLTMPQAL